MHGVDILCFVPQYLHLKTELAIPTYLLSVLCGSWNSLIGKVQAKWLTFSGSNLGDFTMSLTTMSSTQASCDQANIFPIAAWHFR